MHLEIDQNENPNDNLTPFPLQGESLQGEPLSTGGEEDKGGEVEICMNVRMHSYEHTHLLFTFFL